MNGKISCLSFPAQPESREYITSDGVFPKEMWLPKKDMIVPQHSHTYGHTTLVARGRLRVFAGERHLGDFNAPSCIFIQANMPHFMLSLEDNTLAFCIHNLEKTNGSVSVAEENDLSKVPESVLRQHAELA